MKTEENTAALKRKHAIVMAALDYRHKRLAGSFVCDDFDPVAFHYRQEREKTDRDLAGHREDLLQRRLDDLIRGYQILADVDFAGYIKSETGYEIDIFQDLRTRADAILAANEVRNRSELNDLGIILELYRKLALDNEAVAKTRTLFNSYLELNPNVTMLISSPEGEAQNLERVATVAANGQETITTIFSGSATVKYPVEWEEISPDGKRRLRVTQWDAAGQASTYVSVVFETASGAVYSVPGICPGIKACWKDNQTVVIETKKSYKHDVQHRWVRSFDDTVSIEYIQH